MDSKILIAVLVMGAILVAGCSTSGNSYNAPPASTGGAVSGGGGCGRFADATSSSCEIPQEEALAIESSGF